MNLTDKQKELLTQQEKAAQELKLLEFLKTFDDKIVFQQRSRYSSQVWISERVNKEATDLDYYYGCGCCPDSDYNARPVMNLDFNGTPIKVYGIKVYLGDKDYDSDLCHFIEENELVANMTKIGYNETLVSNVLKKRTKHLNSLQKISEAKEEANE